MNELRQSGLVSRVIDAERVNHNISLWHLVAVIARNGRFIIVNFLSVCILVFLISLLLPNWYRAQTTILPPEKETFNLGLGTSLTGGLAALTGGFALPLTASPSDVLASILKSRTVAQAVVEKNNLVQHWHLKTINQAIDKLQSVTSVRVAPDGIILVSVELKNPHLAAQIANSYIAELDWINQQTSATKARATRQFIEERLNQNKKDIQLAEDSLKAFQRRHKTVLLDEETKAAVKSAAELKAQIVADDIALAVLRKTMASDHPEAQRLSQRIEETRKQLARLEFGSSQSSAKNYLSIPFEQLPEVSLRLAELMRDLEVQEKVFELLTQQYEQAKIQERKDTPTVSVLDRAVPPDHKSRPRRSLLVLLGGGLSIIFSLFWIFGEEYFRKMRQVRPEEYSLVQEIRETVSTIPLLGKVFRKH